MTVEDLLKKVEFEEKWLLSAGYNAYNADIAFHTIKWAIKQLSTESDNVGMCQQNVGEISEKQIDGDLVKENTDLVKEDTENADKKGISGETVSQSLVKDGDWISRTELLNAIWRKEYGIDYDGVNLLRIKHIDIIENMPSAEKTASEKLDDIIVRAEVQNIFALLTRHTALLNDIKMMLPSAEKTADYFNKSEVLEPIKHFGSIECPNCGRLLMLEEQTYDWCKGCKEYDNEKHCCHRYSSFIRESLQENINAVLEDIKEDIEKEIISEDSIDYINGLNMALMIINEKHISGKEE